MTLRSALILSALVACKREDPPDPPQLFVDPGRVDLAVDTPLDTFRSADIAIANVGGSPVTLTGITLAGEHADLVALDTLAQADLASSEVVHVTATLIDAGDPFTAPFWEELTLEVKGEDPAHPDDEPLTAEAIVEVGTLWTCDADADGHIALTCGGDDCDDGSDVVNPSMIETCNAVDDDCDATIDEDDAADAGTWFPDVDGDGFGDTDLPQRACQTPRGMTADGTDCDDNDAFIHPAMQETCNGTDDDCDGEIDVDALNAKEYHSDLDADGWGDPQTVEYACARPPGFVTTSTDCDDQDPTAFPGGKETCDGADDDCNGVIDDNATDMIVVYADTDADRHGDAAAPKPFCSLPPGYAASKDDCDDRDRLVYPGALELCDRKDQDCDGVSDDGLPTADYHPDNDADGFGQIGVTDTHCAQPPGHVLASGDCDDQQNSVHPGADEVCDARGQDCDGAVDDNAIDATDWHLDGDGDTFGGPVTTRACKAPPGAVADGTDCDDAVAGVNPAATELCNNADDDCDGTIDEGASLTWFADTDGDKFGDKAAPVLGCTQPVGAVADGTDCDDANAAVNPAAPEACNGEDDDCDDLVDDGSPVNGTWFPDEDDDTFGDSSRPIPACAQPPDTVVDGTDCDDADSARNPAAIELCNGEDDDCDGAIDDGAPAPGTWFTDADGDTFGDPATAVTSCDPPPGAVTDGTDCDDGDPAVNPAAAELCNGEDDDCDGTIDDGAPLPTTWYADSDVDKFGDPATGVTSCNPVPGSVTDNTDCNDKDATIHPGALEQCNSKDDDCDGAIDDGVIVRNWFVDLDSDSFGSPNKTVSACAPPPNFVASNTDCDDSNPAINPSAIEVCNGKDDDCDLVPDDGVAGSKWFRDVDGDKFGDPNKTLTACLQPSGYLADSRDCDDTDPTVNPNAIDSCLDGRDRNCDGVFDACDSCHAFEPVDKVGWKKSFRVSYEGSNGTEDQVGIGAILLPDGRIGFAVGSTLSAGSRAWDVDSYSACDASGALLQEGAEGFISDPDFGSVTFEAENQPARIVLPSAQSVGAGTAWTFNYVLATRVDPNFFFDIPTDGNSRDMGLEVVTVPAGTFTAWRIDSRWNQDNSQWGGSVDRRRSTFWYVEGLGLVQENTVDRNTGAVVMRKQLASYSGLTPLP